MPVGGSGLSIDWRGDGLGGLVKDAEAMAENIRGAIRELLESYAARFLDAMQGDAKWTDRTANARQGLSAEVIERGDVFELVLYHTMEYGIWLELANDGRFAIIMDTIDRLAPQLFAAARALFA